MVFSLKFKVCSQLFFKVMFFYISLHYVFILCNVLLKTTFFKLCSLTNFNYQILPKYRNKAFFVPKPMKTCFLKQKLKHFRAYTLAKLINKIECYVVLKLDFILKY